jgi:small subunit ribosomal protein S1
MSREGYLKTSSTNSVPDLHSYLDINYTDGEWKEFIKLYENRVPSLSNFEIVEGKVVSVNKKEVLIDIGYKSDGLVPFREFRNLTGIKPGVSVEVYIESKEDSKGRLILSHTKAMLLQAWNRIKDSVENGTAIESIVKYSTKGGLVVDISGIECFLPVTQIDYRPVTDLESYVGKAIDVVVLKINKINNNVVVSHKAIIEQGVESQKASILGSLEKGAILEGIVKNIANFGAFVDLGGLDGLLHITDICWKRISHPTDVLDLGQKINVLVLDFDEEKKRVSLGMKQLTPHPWDSLPEDFVVGSKVKTKVVCIADYGIFVEYKPGVEGLIHAAEMTWSFPPNSPRKAFALGDEVEAVVIVLDKENRKLALSIKQLSVDPWKKDDILSRYQVGTKHVGKIKNIAKFGIFVELEPGIDGLLHVSDLSWTTKVEHPSEFVTPGEEVEVQILSIEQDAKKLSLGIKQLLPNPCEVYKDSLQPGCIIQGAPIKFTKTNKGAIIKLDCGVEAFAKKENLVKQDGSEVELGENIDFKVLTFDPENYVINVSHTDIYNKEDSYKTGYTKKHSPGKDENYSNYNQSTKSTFGDIAGLADLKNRLSEIGNKEKQ